MRHRLLLAGVLVLGACFSSKSSKGGGATEAPANKAPAGPDYSATLADPLGFLPLDSELVLGVDAAQLRQSELWRQLEPKLLASAGQGLAAFEAACKFNPITSIRGITMGLKRLGEDKASGVVVLAGLDRAHLTECLRKAAKDNPTLVRSAGDVFTIHTDSGDLAFAFVDAASAVALVGPGASDQALREVLRSGAPLRTSPAFLQMLGLVDLDASLWLFMNGASKVFDSAASTGFRPKAVFGNVSVGSGLSAKLRMRLDSANTASQLATMAQGQLGSVSNFFDKLDVTADDADVVVAAALTQQQLDNLTAMLGGFLGP
jgi:hypothetical protein